MPGGATTATLFVLILLALCSCSCTASSDRVLSLPEYGAVKGVQYAGMAPVNTTANGQLFYYFVECTHCVDSTKAPIVLWTQGGPGASSSMGLFMEMGPYTILENATLRDNPNAWTRVASVLFLDQPVETGYSFSDSGAYVETLDVMATNVLTMFRVFFERHPEYRQNALFLASESFGGHYTPAIASELERSEFAPQLGGILIGNGWIHPEVQHFSFQEYGHNLGLIDEQQRAHANLLAINATAALRYAELTDLRSDWIAAHQAADACEEYVVNSAGLVTEDNVQAVTNPLQPQTDALTVYLNRADVRDALHVPTRRVWTLSSSAANQALGGEIEKSVLYLFPGFLRHMRVWIYVGNMDMTCNVVGIDGTLASLQWDGREPFAEAPRKLWKVDGLLAGYAKTYERLTYVVVRNAGHEVPFYQPRNSLDLFQRFVENRAFD